LSDADSRALVGGRPRGWIPLLAALVALPLGVALDSAEAPLDRPAYDLALRSGWAETRAPTHTTLVLVTDETLARLQERWPMARATWGRLVETLASYGPRAVALDAWFEHPAPKDFVTFAMDLADEVRDGALGDSDDGRKLAESLERASAKLDGDRVFARALADAGRVVVGMACVPDGADRLPTTTLPEGLTAYGEAPTGAPACPRLSPSLAAFALTAAGQGVLDMPRDPDGTVRAARYFVDLDGKAVPTLAVEAARVYAQGETLEALTAQAKDATGARLAFPPRSAFRTVNAIDLLEVGPGNAALDAALRDRLVFVGVSALGTEDLVRTPLGGDAPGVFVQATAAEALLSDHWLRRDPIVAWTAVAALAALVGALAGRTRRLRTTLALAGTGGAVWTGTTAVALASGVLVPFVPALGVVLAGPLTRGVQLYLEARDQRRRADAIRAAFQHYLEPNVVQALIDDPTRLRLGGERRTITAFFSDVEGFTSLSEQLDPTELVRFLNECLGAMSNAILEHGGSIDKYIGDAIVAMFGAPLDQPDHAARACRAALAAQRALDAQRPAWRTRGLPEIRVRIGLNTGDALVGNLGSERRFDYTMLGDTVNLAARLEGANGEYGTDILAGERTAEAVAGAVGLREVDTVRLKGKRQAVRVFEVVSPEPEAQPSSAHAAYARALAQYRAGDFEAAAAGFEALQPNGDAPAEVLAGRARALAAAPPTDWDGVYTMTRK
jgi:adenylate cyclase